MTVLFTRPDGVWEERLCAGQEGEACGSNPGPLVQGFVTSVIFIPNLPVQPFLEITSKV